MTAGVGLRNLESASRFTVIYDYIKGKKERRTSVTDATFNYTHDS